MKKKIAKNLKPIELDAQFRYICPNLDCGFDHWLNIKQCQTKNFKIVCDCGLVFKPKRILNVKIVYTKIGKTKKQNNKEQSKPYTENQKTTESKMLDSYREEISKKLQDYGFTKSESLDLINKAYSINPVDSQSDFIKYILENIPILERINDHNKETVIV